LDHHSVLELHQSFLRDEPLDLNMVRPFVSMTGMEQKIVPLFFVAQEKQSLAIPIKTSDRINVLGKSESGKCPLPGLLLRNWESTP